MSALLPTFLVIGAMKAGTTSLAAYLKAHPEVFVTSPKEPAYFLANYPERDLDWYRSLFAPAGSAIARGEASVQYSAAPEFQGVPGRIHSLVPDVKLIYLVRDPVERTRSHYGYRFVRGVERRPLVEAVHEGSLYVDCSRYAFQLAQFLEYFAREQMLIIGSRELRGQREVTMRRVLEFIGVDPSLPTEVFDQEYANTTDIRAPRSWVEPIARVAARTPLHRLPSSMTASLYRSFLRKIPMPDTTIPPELGRRLWDLYAADLEQFRAFSDVHLELGERP